MRPSQGEMPPRASCARVPGVSCKFLTLLSLSGDGSLVQQVGTVFGGLYARNGKMQVLANPPAGNFEGLPWVGDPEGCVPGAGTGGQGG